MKKTTKNIIFWLVLLSGLSKGFSQNKSLVWHTPNPKNISTNKTFETRTTPLSIELTLTGIKDANPKNFTISTSGESAGSNAAKFTTVPLSNNGSTAFQFTATVDLNEGLNTLVVRYKDEANDLVSEPLKVRYAPPLPSSEDKGGSNLFVLSIGTATDLRYTVKDACDFNNAFSNQGGNPKNYQYEKITLDQLLCKDATSTNIKKKFEILGESQAMKGTPITENDVLIAYLSSHGTREGNEYFMLGSDMDKTAIRSTSVPYSFVIERLSKLPCKKLLFIDACQSDIYGDKNVELAKIANQHKGFAVFLSASPGEYSIELRDSMNGAFTCALLNGLRGAADAAPIGDGNGQISIMELRDYLAGKVPALARSIDPKIQQNPQLIQNDFGDFEFFLTRYFPKKQSYCPITCEPSTGVNLIGINIKKINSDIIDYDLSNVFVTELSKQGLRARIFEDGSNGNNRFSNVIVGKYVVEKKGVQIISPDLKLIEYDVKLILLMHGRGSDGKPEICSERLLKTSISMYETDDSGKVNRKAVAELAKQFAGLKPLPLCD